MQHRLRARASKVTCGARPCCDLRRRDAFSLLPLVTFLGSRTRRELVSFWRCVREFALVYLLQTCPPQKLGEQVIFEG